MLKLGQFDLQLALMTFCTQGKNIQNEGNAVDDPFLEHPFQVALLRRGKGLIKEDDFGLQRFDQLMRLFHLAGADEMSGVRFGPTDARSEERRVGKEGR